MPGEMILKAIRHISSTGRTGFEGLVRDLITSVTGHPFRLCKSGSQHGTDALADEIPVSIETKRYGEKTHLKLRELQGELADAAGRYPDLQLWILACSIEVSVQDYEALRTTGENLGLATFILDASPAAPELDRIPRISALCAINPAATLAILGPALNSSEISKESLSPLSAIETELQNIAAMPRFKEWCSHLTEQLTSAPIWNLAAKRHNAKLLKMIEEGSWISLGTEFNAGTAVSRTMKRALDKWFDAASHGNMAQFAVVQGERYDGKTWCIFDWLRSKLPILSVPLFYIPSKRGMQGIPLHEHLLSEMKDALNSYSRHAEAFFRRNQSMRLGNHPWCLVVLDGLNEYPDSERCLAHISEALSTAHPDRRPCVVVATVRTRSWASLGNFLPSSLAPHLLTVGHYDDDEFRNALSLRGLPETYAESLPSGAREMIRRPRFLDLVIKHKDQLGGYEAVTIDVLNWLDTCDKLRSRIVAPTALDNEGYQTLLRQLATRFKPHLKPTRVELAQILNPLTSDPSAALQDLESEGVLEKGLLGYKVAPDRLALGMGLHLLDSLLLAHDSNKPLREHLRDLLSPLQETDEFVARLRMATVIALLHDPAIPATIIDLLVSEWLSSRNLGRKDLHDIRAIRRLLLAPLLRLAPETWTRCKGDERLQELSQMVFIDALSWDQERIREAVSYWFRLVPEQGSSYLQRTKEMKGLDPAQAVTEVIEDPDLADLRLTRCGDEGLLSLHRVGLHLVGQMPNLIGPNDLLALTGAELAASDSIGDAERLIFRRSLSSIDASWFQDECQRSAIRIASSRRRRLLYRLTARAMRADLENVMRNTTPPPDPKQEAFFSSLRPLDLETYKQLRGREFIQGEDPKDFVEKARDLVKAPDLPLPSDQRLHAMQSVLAKCFANAALYEGLGKTAEDHLFETVLPVISAWFPKVAKDVFRRLIQSLPNQEPSKRILAHVLWQHVMLLDEEAHRVLLDVSSDSGSGSSHEKWIAGKFLLAVLPSMPADERLAAVVERQETEFEWTKLYDLVAFLVPSGAVRNLLERLRCECNPLRAKRLRYLLAHIGGFSLGEQDHKLLTEAIQLGGDDRFSALWLAASGQFYNLPSNALVPIATDKSKEHQLQSDYASILLLQESSLKDTSYNSWPSQLSPIWRAEAAIKNPGFRSFVLDEIEEALKELVVLGDSGKRDSPSALPTAVSVEEFDITKGVGRYSISKGACSGGLYWRSPETTTGGLGGSLSENAAQTDTLVLNSEQAAKRMNELSAEAMNVIHQRQAGHRTCWSTTEFPLRLLQDIDLHEPQRLAKWSTCLQANPARSRVFWAGLLQSLFLHFLRKGDSRAGNLWPMVLPFHRESAGHLTTFSINGVNSLLIYLSDPASDDSLASEFLVNLVSDALTDWELFMIVLGTRSASPIRLTGIARRLLSDNDPEQRARGVRIAGWIDGFKDDLLVIEQEDPSLWVRQIATLSLEAISEQDWAHHWFNQALHLADKDARWGASQLFLACVDERTVPWAFQLLKTADVPAQTKGEGWLLLEEAAQSSERRANKLKDTFLKHKVKDLQAVCHPWHSTSGWENLELA